MTYQTPRKSLKNKQKTTRKHSTKSKKVLIALSGGIDSAVSAWKLLQAGYQVEAVFMKNWSSTTGLKYDECPWLKDRQDALRVSAFLGIPMHTVDFEKQYEQKVLDYFFQEYQAGRTPNPDVMCNKEIKFKLLYNWAMSQGFDYLATGHYAQIKQVKHNGIVQYSLCRSKDEFKDQTYFIYNIASKQLAHLLFPIGDMKKAAVKILAKKIGLPNVDRKESMGLCFVGKVRLKEFLSQKLRAKVGDIVIEDSRGVQKKIGQHDGLANYTIGQRHGIKVGAGGPWFVIRKDLAKNRLVVTNDPKDTRLQTQNITLHSLHWLKQGVDLSKPVKMSGRFRHQGKLEPVTISVEATGKNAKQKTLQVQFVKPQLAVASGQSLVLYQGKECLGGGVII